MAEDPIKAGENSIPIICRPAMPGDREQVLELSSRIWDGQDYITHVWDAWLAEPDGVFCAAEAGGQVVGLGKLTRLSEKDWWLEGLRVHPDFQSHGIGRHIHEYLLEWWRRHGSGAVRLLAYYDRVKVHQLCARDGFVKIGEMSTGLAPALDGPADGFERLSEADVNDAFPIMKDNPILKLNFGMIDLSWRWGRPRREHLEAAAREGRAWWWHGRRNRSGLLTMWKDYSVVEERQAQLSGLACSMTDLAEALTDFRRLAGHLGYDKAIWNASLDAEIEQAMAAAGFHRDRNKKGYLFEKRMSEF